MKTAPSSARRRAGLSLAELMVALAIGSIVGAVMAVLTFFTARSFAALTNYVDLDQKSRHALDKMSQEIRQADSVTSFSTNAISLSYNGGTLSYTYSPDGRTLTRTLGGQSETLLTECDRLTFAVYQRTPIANSYEQYSASSLSTSKMVQFSWTCSRTILGQAVNTESMQSAKIVIRKQRV